MNKVSGAVRSRGRSLALSALALVLVGAVVTTVALLRSPHPDRSAAVLAAVVALWALVVANVPRLWRIVVRPRTDAAVGDDPASALADELVVHWRAEADHRKLKVPAPIMVSWRLVTPEPEQARAWAMRPRALRPDVPPNATRSAPEQLSSGVVQELHRLYNDREVDRVVVIGEPGAGKTSALLLLLLEALRVRAHTEPTRTRTAVPVPVLLSLGDWRPSDETLESWAARVIARDYPGAIDRTTCLELLRHGRVALFLDGFDEMPRDLWAAAREQLDKASHVPVVVACRPDAEAQAGLGYGYLIQLEPVAVETTVAYLLEHASASGQCWDPLVAHLRRAPEGAVARALRTPLMIRLAIDVFYKRDPSELLDARRFPDQGTVERFLIGQIIPVAYGPALGRKQTSHRISAEDAERCLRAFAQRMDGSRDLAWWRIRHWLPWMPPAVLSVFFLGALWVAAAALGGGAVGVALGLPAVLAGVPAAALTTQAATSRGRGQMKGLTPRLLVALGIGTMFGACLAIVRAIEDGRFGAGLSTVVLGIGLSIVGGMSLGVLALHDGPLVAQPQPPREADLVFGLPIGLVTGLVYGAIEGPWLVAAAVAAVASAGFIVGVAWTRPPERPQEGASPASSFRTDLRGALVLGFLISATVASSLVLVLEEAMGIRAALVAAVPSGVAFGLCTSAAASQAPAFVLMGLWLWLRGEGPPVLLWLGRRWTGFLEDARAREVLRCVGTLYQFRHARLQDQLCDDVAPPAGNAG